MNTLHQIITSHYGCIFGCLHFIVTIIGAICTQLFYMEAENAGTINFLKIWAPNKNDNWYKRMNCIILVVVGSIISFIILEPTTIKTSLFAGLTWCGTLQSIGLIHKTSEI